MAEPETSTSPVAAEPPAAVVTLIACIGGVLAKANINVVTKKVTQMPVPSAPCPAVSQSLSPDATKIGFSVRNVKDNSNHVGWVDLITNERVDITQSLSEASSALAAVRQDASPVFAPSGEFVFQDKIAKKINFVSVTTKAITSSVDSIQGFSDDLYIGQDNSLTSMGSRDISFAFPIPGAPGSKYCDSKRNRAQFFPGDGTAVLADLTVVHDTGVNGGSGCQKTAVVRTLIPASDFLIRASVLEPASKTVYFGAVRGTQNFLFSVPLDGSSAAVQVADITALGVTYTPAAVAVR